VRLGARTVTTPQGVRWRVRRVWVERRLPRWRKVSLGGATEDVTSFVPDPDESIVLWLALIVGTIVVAVVVIPLLLFGIELILLGLLVALAILGRSLLGRPWLVRAAPVDDREAAISWRVVGWRRSGRVIEEVAAALATGAMPQPAEPVEEVVTGRLAEAESAHARP
jgi:hypothetical protein